MQGGYNHALQHIEADIFCLLNSDVRVTEGWLHSHLTHFEDERIAVVQPKIKDEKRPLISSMQEQLGALSTSTGSRIAEESI